MVDLGAVVVVVVDGVGPTATTIDMGAVGESATGLCAITRPMRRSVASTSSFETETRRPSDSDARVP